MIVFFCITHILPTIAFKQAFLACIAFVLMPFELKNIQSLFAPSICILALNFYLVKYLSTITRNFDEIIPVLAQAALWTKLVGG